MFPPSRSAFRTFACEAPEESPPVMTLCISKKFRNNVRKNANVGVFFCLFLTISVLRCYAKLNDENKLIEFNAPYAVNIFKQVFSIVRFSFDNNLSNKRNFASEMLALEKRRFKVFENVVFSSAFRWVSMKRNYNLVSIIHTVKWKTMKKLVQNRTLT